MRREVNGVKFRYCNAMTKQLYSNYPIQNSVIVVKNSESVEMVSEIVIRGHGIRKKYTLGG